MRASTHPHRRRPCDRPVHAALAAESPGIVKNRDFRRDAFNVLVGIVWQTAITASPIFLVIEQFGKFLICLAVVAVATIILKFTWYDRLEDAPRDAEELDVAVPRPRAGRG